MFRLYAGLEENWGRAVKDILRKFFPDAKDEIAKASDQGIGQKMLNIALKQTQYNETKAQDAIQDAIMYWSTGTSEYNKGAVERRDYPKKLKEWEAAKAKAEAEGKPAPEAPEKPKDVKVPEPFDFSKSGSTWEDALNNMYSNLRTRSMSHSMGYTKKEKKERSVDQAFGQRGEEGGAPEGGEGRMPTPESEGGVGAAESLGQALDDKAGVKQFVDLIDDHIGDLKAFLPDDQRKLFELIFDDDIGSFGSDIKENMSQATALKDKHPDLYQKNAKRWSGFVGDLRKKLLESIWDYVDTHLTKQERSALRETFFADVDPAYVRRKEKEKTGDKADYQQGIDERKLSKFKWMEQNGTLDDKSKKSYDALKKKLQGTVDVDAIPAQENPQAKGWTLHSKRAASARFSLEEVSSRVARAFGRTGT
jgi:hypothetical protein